MWNNIICERKRKSEINSASTTLGTTIDKNDKRGRRYCVKSEQNLDLLAMWVDASESMIQDEGINSLNKKYLDMPR